MPFPIKWGFTVKGPSCSNSLIIIHTTKHICDALDQNQSLLGKRERAEISMSKFYQFLSLRKNIYYLDEY